jgi:lysophospholipase L1-like esterase
MVWGSFVAVGDSFTEGMNDEAPGGGLRGWADIVAAQLARHHRDQGGVEPFRYANLAVRGKLFDAIVDHQVPEAVRMAPDLVSFAGGGNDVLRRNFDASAMTARFDHVIGTLRAGGSDVIIFRWADVTSRLPGRRMIMPRMEILNRCVGEVAERHGAYLVDLFHDVEFHNPRLWSDDRLHMSTAGHHRVAAHVLAALGVAADPAWFERPLPPDPKRLRDDLRWARQHFAPWVKRRLQGRSSGDTVTAKRPTLAPLVD